jgi:nicotinamidase-related amidase
MSPLPGYLHVARSFHSVYYVQETKVGLGSDCVDAPGM